MACVFISPAADNTDVLLKLHLSSQCLPRHSSTLASMEVLASVSESFWSPSIWLPPNITWDSFTSEPGYAQFYDLAYPFPLAIILIAVRLVVERGIFRPVGKYLGIKDTVYKAPDDNPVLEAAYVARQKNYEALSKAAGLTVRQVERWFRQKQMAGK